MLVKRGIMTKGESLEEIKAVRDRENGIKIR